MNIIISPNFKEAIFKLRKLGVPEDEIQIYVKTLKPQLLVVKDYSLAGAEIERISNVMAMFQGKNNCHSAMAKLLGITRSTLYAKIKEYRLDESPEKAENENTDKKTI